MLESAYCLVSAADTESMDRCARDCAQVPRYPGSMAATEPATSRRAMAAFDASLLQGQVAARGIDNVRVLINVNDAQKAWLYAHCEAFLFPSLAEGFGLPPVEAMHFGKAVFLSRLTSLPEVGGDAAFYWDDFAPASMRRGIEESLLRHALPGHAAATHAHARTFTWQRCATAHVDLYRRTLGIASRS